MNKEGHTGIVKTTQRPIQKNVADGSSLGTMSDVDSSLPQFGGPNL
jgi:hypothetical protein